MSGYLVLFRLPTGRRDVPLKLKGEYVAAATPAEAEAAIRRKYPDARNIRKPEPR